jgi:hypothetical protein
MKFFTKKASHALPTQKGEEAWDRRWAQYEQHLKEIRPRLSRGWRKVAATEFHDTAIFSFGTPRGNEFIVNIDMNPLWKQPPLRICSLHFYGIRRVHMPNDVLKEWVIYTEVHATQRGGGELRALLAEDTELKIEADDVDFVLNYRFGDW